MSARGFGLAYLVAGIALVAALAGLYAFVDGRGYKRGAAEKQVEWDKSKEETRKELAALKAARDALLLQRQRELEIAHTNAAGSEAKWKEEVRRARREGKTLASCGPAEPVPGIPRDRERVAGTGLRPMGGDRGARAPGIRLHWRFVGLHDGAYTDRAGQPLFGASAEHAREAARADTASPYGLEDLLDVHGDNAAGHSACIRDLNEVMDRVEKLEAQWGQRGQP